MDTAMPELITLQKIDFYNSVESELSHIISPLSQIGINCVTYIKKHSSGEEIILTSSANWAEKYYKNKLYLDSLYLNKPKQFPTGYYVWPMQSELPIFEVGRNILTSDIGLTIVRNFPDWQEFYFFSWPNRSIHYFNYTVNHIDLLYQFIAYFQKKVKTLIDIAEKQHCIVLPSISQQQISPLNNSPENNFDLLNPKQIIELGTQLTKQLGVSARETLEIIIKGSFKFTKRELDCIYYLLQGHSAKESAKTLSLSSRTIEAHYDNIKRKLSCSSKFDVINKFLKEELSMSFLNQSTDP